MRILEPPLHLKGSFLQISGSVTPSPAPPNMARIWYDESTSNLKFSVNGGAFSENPGALALQDLTAWELTNAPVASATTGVLELDSGTFSGSANGTVLAINLGSGTADLIRAQKAGVDRLVLTETGILYTLKGIFGSTNSSLATLTVHQTDAATAAQILRMAASPTGSAFEIQTSAAVAILQVTPVEGRLGVGAAANSVYKFQISAGATGVNDATSGSGRLVNVNAGTSTACIFTFSAGPNAGATEVTGFVGAQILGYSPTPLLSGRVALGNNNSTGAAGLALFCSQTDDDLIVTFGGATKFTFANLVLTLASAVDIAVGTTTGTKIGTVGGAAGQKLGFFGATAITQPLLATGSTTDQVITALQNLGLFRQS